MLSEYIDAAVVQAHHLQVNESEFLSLVQERLSLFQSKTKTTQPRMSEVL